MNFSEFIMSSIDDQNLALQNAALVATLVNPPYHYSLLQLNGFYIELVHDEVTHRTNLIAFENTDKLDPYLEQITLP
jgi:hypothetical protein